MFYKLICDDLFHLNHQCALRLGSKIDEQALHSIQGIRMVEVNIIIDQAKQKVNLILKGKVGNTDKIQPPVCYTV